MRILVISDIHSNLAALEAVLADAPRHDIIWSLGDVVGYGPQPNECINLLLEHKHQHIAGNHDWGALDKISLESFVVPARKAALWTRDRLTPESWAYLERAPLTYTEQDVTLAHGSPGDPIWEYIVHSDTARENLARFQTSLCLVGHSHIPVVFQQAAPEAPVSVMRPSGEALSLTCGRYIINPGSVGQPRDGDPRAAYALLDTDAKTIQHFRIAYDIRATQKKMRIAGLSQRDITRLEYGF